MSLCVLVCVSVSLSVCVSVCTITQKTRKRFSEKPIVAFTNSTVSILDFYIYDYIWCLLL